MHFSALICCLFLVGCNGNNVPISDVMHPEVHNNIFLGALERECGQIINAHKNAASVAHKNIHEEAGRMLSDMIEQLKQLRAKAEDHAKQRFDKVTEEIGALHARVQKRD